MDHIEDYRGILHHPVKRKGDYTHRDQLNFYGLGGVKMNSGNITDFESILSGCCVLYLGKSLNLNQEQIKRLQQNKDYVSL